jgi:hypothetical protein
MQFMLKKTDNTIEAKEVDDKLLFLEKLKKNMRKSAQSACNFSHRLGGFTQKIGYCTMRFQMQYQIVNPKSAILLYLLQLKTAF